MVNKLFGVLLLGLLATDAQAAPENYFTWNQTLPGLTVGRYQPPADQQLPASDVLLVKIDPKLFEFDVAYAPDLGIQRSNAKTLTKSARGIIGINVNFFDPANRPLGLVVKNRRELSALHRGGNLLSGLFAVDADGNPFVIHRDEFPPGRYLLALQAGPRLLNHAQAILVSKNDEWTRRSGVAILKDGSVLLFATIVRFPGSSLQQIQQMLLKPEIGAVDALNFDGGGSSQIFLDAIANAGKELFISGGDDVPVALVVRKREESK